MASLLKTLPRQRLLLALGSAILVAISAVSIWLVERIDDDAARVTKALEVQTRLADLRLSMRRSESGERGFLLTEDPAYLGLYRAGVSAVSAALDELGIMTADNPVQRNALRELEPVVRERLAQMATVIARHQAGDREGALAIVRGNRGRALVEEIGQRIAAMQAEEDRSRQARSADFQRTSRLLLSAALAGALLIVALAILSQVLVRRSQEALRASQRALEEANAGLETTVAERTADLREANEELQRYAYIVSHDLRAPLVNIMGFTSEIESLRENLSERLAELDRLVPAGATVRRDQDLVRDLDEAVGFIKASIAKMDRLIGAILKVSRDGQREFRPEPVDMGALVGSIAATLAHQAERAGATIMVGALPPVTSDRLALEQIFTNLMDNALKYLRPGVPGRVEVKGRAAGPGVVYEVEDNGRGIAERDRERVFELFRRAGSQEQPGEGIGLASVRNLVRRIGGTVTLTSEPGRGSTFAVRLPAALAAQPERRAA